MNMNKQSGFTLVEIAIVLVIIGLLLGGVLKGQEMIKNAEIKNFINDMNGLSAAMHTYRDRYQALPGDDNRATTHLAGVAGMANGNGNGRITGGERTEFYDHLRGAGIIKGTGNSRPTHALGGIISIDDAQWGMRGVLFCANNVNGANALIIDTKVDDGVANTGSVRAGTSAAYGPTATYNQLCFQG
ncbi:MAG: prepilin-type cleavage/methylation domain-containing protein [Piscirickettsiaceae bacterium]|nr:MAG: prepilin-type cleavage/methylation domain-containing protein [Piscirickettsiaceae bacterium]